MCSQIHVCHTCFYCVSSFTPDEETDINVEVMSRVLQKWSKYRRDVSVKEESTIKHLNTVNGLEVNTFLHTIDFL